MARSPYIHGTSLPEQERLARMNGLLNEGSLRELLPRPGERLLELGAGLGIFARAVARAVGPTGSVVAVEGSEEQLARARALAAADGEDGLVDLRLGDVADPPLAPDEQGSFDAAHARFLLEHLPDPLAAVRAMVRAVRPGGRVALSDDDHEQMRLWPEPAGFDRAWRAYYELYSRRGCDPLIGRRLVELLVTAGARPVRTTFVFFGGCAGEPSFEVLAANMLGVIEGAREELLADGALSADELDSALAAYRAWTARSDAALWYGMCWAEGVRP